MQVTFTVTFDVEQCVKASSDYPLDLSVLSIDTGYHIEYIQDPSIEWTSPIQVQELPIPNEWLITGKGKITYTRHISTLINKLSGFLFRDKKSDVVSLEIQDCCLDTETVTLREDVRVSYAILCGLDLTDESEFNQVDTVVSTLLDTKYYYGKTIFSDGEDDIEWEVRLTPVKLPGKSEWLIVGKGSLIVDFTIHTIVQQLGSYLEKESPESFRSIELVKVQEIKAGIV